MILSAEQVSVGAVRGDNFSELMMARFSKTPLQGWISAAVMIRSQERECYPVVKFLADFFTVFSEETVAPLSHDVVIRLEICHILVAASA